MMFFYNFAKNIPLRTDYWEYMEIDKQNNKQKLYEKSI